MPEQPFLSRLRAGELTLMMGIRSARTPDAVRIARATGHHAVMIDLEHSAMSVDVAAALAATAHDIGLVPLVRIPEREYGVIGRLLDGGAQGIIAPRVETAEQALAVARANFLYAFISGEYSGMARIDLAPYVAVAGNPTALLNLVDANLLQGRMSATTRAAIGASLNATTDLKQRAITALYLTAIAADFAVQP